MHLIGTHQLRQGRPTSGPPKVLKWPAPKVSASVGWLILSRWRCELQKWVLEFLLYLLLGKSHKIHRNDLFFVCVCSLAFWQKKTIKSWVKTFFFWSSPSFWQKKTIKSEWRPFFFGDHHEIHPKTLVCEEDKVRLNFGPRNFWNSKFGPRLKKVGRPWIKATSLNEI